MRKENTIPQMEAESSCPGGGGGAQGPSVERVAVRDTHMAPPHRFVKIRDMQSPRCVCVWGKGGGQIRGGLEYNAVS